MDGAGCQCWARCAADCACNADWTPKEIYDLRAELAQCRKDAERYRFIKDEHDRIDPVGRVVWKRMGDRDANEWVDVSCGAGLNALIDYEIDAAMQAGEKIDTA